MKNRGFTLIELMIVIGIIALLTVCAITSYDHYAEKAKSIQIPGI